MKFSILWVYFECSFVLRFCFVFYSQHQGRLLNVMPHGDWLLHGSYRAPSHKASAKLPRNCQNLFAPTYSNQWKSREPRSVTRDPLSFELVYLKRKASKQLMACPDHFATVVVADPQRSQARRCVRAQALPLAHAKAGTVRGAHGVAGNFFLSLY